MDYSQLIQEDLFYLQEQERHAQQAIVRDRIRFLRLLKSGQCTTQKAAGEAIGLKLRQSQWLWQQYVRRGLGGLTQTGFAHNFGKLSACQIAQLIQYLRQDQVTTLEQAQAFIRSSFQVEYTIGGICLLFQRLKIKNKTARPVNIRKQEQQAEAFKKTLLS